MDLSSSPSSSRKRQAPHDCNEDYDNDLAYHAATDTPSKRLQNARGLPVAKETLTYNASKLLCDLATTRLFVTANFGNYDPASSNVLLCIVRESDALYRALCHISPSLYKLSPTLQALAIMPPGQANISYWQALQRVIPIVTPDDLDEEAAYNLSTFMASLEAASDVIALLDSTGRCIWTSVELDNEGSDSTTALRRALQLKLRREHEGTDGAMDLG